MTANLAKDNWELIVSHLASRGARRHILDHAQQWDVYCLGDGFGKMTPQQLSEIGWDWSHVRDSTDKAVAAMADKIRSYYAHGMPGRVCVNMQSPHNRTVFDWRQEAAAQQADAGRTLAYNPSAYGAAKRHARQHGIAFVFRNDASGVLYFMDNGVLRQKTFPQVGLAPSCG